MSARIGRFEPLTGSRRQRWTLRRGRGGGPRGRPRANTSTRWDKPWTTWPRSGHRGSAPRSTAPADGLHLARRAGALSSLAAPRRAAAPAERVVTIEAAAEALLKRRAVDADGDGRIRCVISARAHAARSRALPSLLVTHTRPPPLLGRARALARWSDNFALLTAFDQLRAPFFLNGLHATASRRLWHDKLAAPPGHARWW